MMVCVNKYSKRETTDEVMNDLLNYLLQHNIICGVVDSVATCDFEVHVVVKRKVIDDGR